MKHHVAKSRSFNLRARYDLAQTTDENRRLWSAADSLDADACNNLGVRILLRNRARYVYANNSRARGMINTLAKMTVGPRGPRLQMRLGDGVRARQLASRIEASFRLWAREVRLARKLRIVRIAKVISGEIFVAMRINPRLDHPVKLDLQLIECDQVSNPMAELADNDADGVFFDDFGNPETYRVLRVHPGAMFRMLSPHDYEDQSARFIRHYFGADRPGQHRGVPEITPACQLVEEGRRFRAAVLAAAETAADYAMALETTAPPDGDDATQTGKEGEEIDIAPMDTLELRRRMATVLPAGFKLNQTKAEQPTTTFKEFARELLAEVARCLEMPVSLASLDAADANMSSSYVINQPFATSLSVERGDIEDELLDPILDAWLTLAFGGESPLARRIPSDLNHLWYWHPIIKHADPAKLASAQDTKLRNCTTTLAREYAEEGEDWEEQLEQIAKEKALKKKLGITDEEAAPANRPRRNEDEDEDDETE